MDSKMGVTYYGFKRGKYSYVVGVINGAKKKNIQCPLISKKIVRLYNLTIVYLHRSEVIIAIVNL